MSLGVRVMCIGKRVAFWGLISHVDWVRGGGRKIRLKTKMKMGRRVEVKVRVRESVSET